MALVSDPEEIPTICCRSDAKRPRYGEQDVVAAVGVTAQLRVDLDVDGELTDPLADALELALVDPLSGRRLGGTILDSDDELAAGAVSETDAVTGELRKIT